VTVASELTVGLFRRLVDETAFRNEADRELCRDAVVALADHLGVLVIGDWPEVVDNALHGTLDAEIADVATLPVPAPTWIAEP
jgi:hypothetical protein